MADFEYKDGFGHTKYHINTRVLQAMQEKALENMDFEFLDVLNELELNQGVDTRFIQYNNRIAIYMSHNGYTPSLTSEMSEKLFNSLFEIYKY